MTAPADSPPVPRPLPSPPRRLWPLGALALAAVAAFAVWWFALRDAGEPEAGPLGTTVAQAIGILRRTGAEFTYGDAVAWNAGREDAVLKRISLVDASPGLSVLETRAAGPGRRILSVGSHPQWPAPDLGDLHPVAGFRVAPQSQPAGDRGVELVFKLRAGRPGRLVSRGVAVDYRYAGKDYRVVLRHQLAVCVAAPGERQARRCAPPPPVD
jgi:hypothetical protein